MFSLTPRLMPSSSSNSSDPMSDMSKSQSLYLNSNEQNLVHDKRSANIISRSVCSGSLVCVAKATDPCS